MANAQLVLEQVRQRSGPRFKKWLLISLIVIAALLIGAAILLWAKWPFTRASVTRRLQEATSSTVQIRTFRSEYFPHPGCVAEGVVFRREGKLAAIPFMTVQKLTVRGTFTGLFTGHLALVRGEGVHVAFPPFGVGQPLSGSNQSNTVIDQLMADGAVVDFLARRAGAPPTRFFMHRFRLHGLGGDRAMAFESAFINPKPRGEVVADGVFGPWKTGEGASTRVSGRYVLRQAQLASFRGIAGLLSSAGTFQGTFHHLQVQGTTDTPDFEVTRSGHKFHLSTQFRAYVNTTNADVVLDQVAGLLGRTRVVASGHIGAPAPGKQKSASLDFLVRNGRVEDILLLFVRNPRSPLVGVSSFRAHVIIPSGPQPFLRKVELVGDFGIDQSHFTSAHTQQGVDELSQRARRKKDKEKEDAERVLSDLGGHVVLRNGSATFSNLSFSVPGATARMHGTYNLISERIDLHGTLRMDTKLSDATSGVKSFLLKALGALRQNDHPHAPVPVGITGTYSHPSYHISPGAKK